MYYEELDDCVELEDMAQLAYQLQVEQEIMEADQAYNAWLDEMTPPVEVIDSWWDEYDDDLVDDYE